ncbi:MAG: PAS domain-containing protein [Desulfobulbaceae bacterium]|nr:PAS domain-containing protein [Desulfobulbaceae bacterium]
MKNPECHKFFPKQLDQSYSHLSVSLSASLINSLILLYILWGKINSEILLTWIAAHLLLFFFRITSRYFYIKSQDTKTSLTTWTFLYFGGLLSSGVIWGSAGFFIFLTDSVPHQMFIAFVLGGNVAGSIASTSAMQYAFYCFSLPALLPISISFLYYGNEIHVAMGVMALIFLISSISISLQMFAKSCKSLQYDFEKDREIEQALKVEEQLRQHKNELEQQVRARTVELTKTNKELREEIEERKNAEKELFDKREQFRTIIENIPEAIYRCELKIPWRVHHMSENIFPFTGYRAGEFMDGKLVYADLVHPEDLDFVAKEVDASVANHKPYVIDYRIVHQDGTLRWVHERGQAKYDSNGNPLWLDGVIADITEQKRIKEELQKIKNIESLGTFAGGIAHDFNNLLMAIFGNIEMAGDTLSPSSIESQFLRASLRSLDKAKKLTGQLLTFARGGAPVIQATSFKDLIEEAEKNILKEPNIKTTLTFSDDLWLVSIDQKQMNQVLYNLFTNAKEAMPDGGNFFIYGENCEIEENGSPLAPGKYVKITVQDEGRGIAPDILPKVFDPYFSTKTKGADKGTGLGLAVCLSIITKHKGRISAESTPGKGTTFTILIPASQHDAEKSDKSTTKQKTPQATGRRILVLEDEKEVSQVVGRMLKRLGYEFEIVEDGRNAVELYQKAFLSDAPFDIVLLDLTIHGGMGGRETMRHLREIDPKIKAIVASGYADDIVVSNFEEYGFLASLEKPYTLDSLTNLLKQYA